MCVVSEVMVFRKLVPPVNCRLPVDPTVNRVWPALDAVSSAPLPLLSIVSAAKEVWPEIDETGCMPDRPLTSSVASGAVLLIPMLPAASIVNATSLKKSLILAFPMVCDPVNLASLFALPPAVVTPPHAPAQFAKFRKQSVSVPARVGTVSVWSAVAKEVKVFMNGVPPENRRFP